MSLPHPRRPLTIRARRAFVALVLLLCVPYVTAVAALYFLQRTFLYPGSRPGAEPAAIVVPGSERVTLTTTDGERLAAWHVAPEPRRPIMLFFHGNGGALDAQTGRWRRLRDAGAGVLAVSFRGYPGSTGHPTEVGLHADARAAYEWLRTRYTPEQIVIHGNSLGTGPAVRLAADVPARALILEAPFTAIVDVAAERYPWAPVHALMLDQFRSRDWIAQVKMPVLVVHGDTDRVIPVTHAVRLYALANQPKQLVRLRDSDHNTLVGDGLYGYVWPFLEHHARPQRASGK